jgi:branched-chain amino acid transport system substrate-binding protein
MGGFMMKKAGWLGLMLFMAVALFAATGLAADEWGEYAIPKDAPIKIGMGTMLSGGYANFGLDIKNGAELALTEKGEILGHKLVLEPGDDQCEGAPSAALAEKWGNDPNMVGVLGYMCSSGTIAASDIHNKYKQVEISASATGKDVTARGIPIIFRICWNDNIQGKVAADFVLKNKWMKAALIHDKSTYGQGLVDVFKATFEKGGGKVLAYEALTRGDKDFSPILTKIKPLNPEVINFGGMVAEGTLLARQMRRMGIKSKFVGFEGIYSEKDFIQAAGKAAIGAFATYSKNPKSQVFTDWQKKFTAKYGAPVAYAPHAYDAATVMMMAIEKVARKQGDGSLVIGKKALRDAVSAIKYEGITGPISFDQYGDRIGIAVTVNEVVCEGERCFFKELE